MTITNLLTVAVIGANGHVGSGVVHRALLEGHAVVGVDLALKGMGPAHLRYIYKQVDASNYKSLRAAVEGCTALVLLSAAYNQHDDEGLITDDVQQYDIHNLNVSMSYNSLCVAAALGIDKVVLASSVNALGMLFSQNPQYDYIPIDERHTPRPEEAYSLSKLFAKLQADAFCRRHPSMRITTLRFHWVVPDKLVDREYLHAHKGSWRDLWGWVSLNAASKAVLLSLTVPESSFPVGHETFFIVAQTSCQQTNSMDLLRSKFPGIKEIRTSMKGNAAFFDCSKAERMLGWKEEGFPSC